MLHGLARLALTAMVALYSIKHIDRKPQRFVLLVAFHLSGFVISARQKPIITVMPNAMMIVSTSVIFIVQHLT